jgi:hypothetical protein
MANVIPRATKTAAFILVILGALTGYVFLTFIPLIDDTLVDLDNGATSIQVSVGSQSVLSNPGAASANGIAVSHGNDIGRSGSGDPLKSQSGVPLPPHIMGPDWCARVLHDRNRNLSHINTTLGAEVIYNGIRLPRLWPPTSTTIESLSSESLPPQPPYLDAPPEVIPIDVGRQLFVDTFLTDYEANVERRGHKFVLDHKPVLPDLSLLGQFFSDGIWYDGDKRELRLYIRCPGRGARGKTCVHFSQDGEHFATPDLTKRQPIAGSSEKRDTRARRNCASQCGTTSDQSREFSSITLNDDATTPHLRYVVGYENYQGKSTRPLWVMSSADGLGDWIRHPSPAQLFKAHTNHAYNPFRKVWIWIIRQNGCERIHRRRMKRYREAAWLSVGFKFYLNVAKNLVREDAFTCVGWLPGEPVLWLGANTAIDTPPSSKVLHKQFYKGRQAKLSDFIEQKVDRLPDLYLFTAVAYESVTLGTFNIWDGLATGATRLKRITASFEFSRDGFHYTATSPRNLVVDMPSYCTYATVGSGNYIIVNDEIHVYMSCGVLPGRKKSRLHRGRLRRDGFVSLQVRKEGDHHGDGRASRGNTGLKYRNASTGVFVSGDELSPSSPPSSPTSRNSRPTVPPTPGVGVVVTRPLSACGRHLFVNVKLGTTGTLTIAVLQSGRDPDSARHLPIAAAMPGFGEKDMTALPGRLDSTKYPITWHGADTLPAALGSSSPFRLRFTLTGDAQFFSFWVARDAKGASLGFLAGGEVGRPRNVDF